MYNEQLQGSLIEIAGELFEKSKAGQVNWQTVGGEPANYYVLFGDGTSFIVTLKMSDEVGMTAMLSLKIGSTIAVRLEASEEDKDFAKYKQVFDEAHRAATGWDKAIQRIQKQLASGETVGEAAGDIPI